MFCPMIFLADLKISLIMADRSWLSRTELLIGKEKLAALENKHVLVVGLGGVGSFAAEFICRGGVGKMTIVDGDVVDPSNRNRQLPALATNHGVSKAEIMRDRLLSINPDLDLTVVKSFLQPTMVNELLSNHFDYVIEAIDSITPKIMVMTLAFLIKMLPSMSGMHIALLVWFGYVLPTMTSTVIWGADAKKYMCTKIAVSSVCRLLGLLATGYVLAMW